MHTENQALSGESVHTLSVTDADVSVVSEAIVVVDILGSSTTSERFGWRAVGRGLMRDVRQLVTSIGLKYHLQSIKSTGDGYLLTYGDPQDSQRGVVHAAEASLELLDKLDERNRHVPEHLTIRVRLALHFGEVDIIQGDREGPTVAYPFRLTAIGHAEVSTAMSPIPLENLPLENYLYCSEQVATILAKRCRTFAMSRIGLFRLRGFSGWHEVYRVAREPGSLPVR